MGEMTNLEFISSQCFHLAFLTDCKAIDDNFASGRHGDLKAVPVLFDLWYTLDVFAFLDQIVWKTLKQRDEYVSHCVHVAEREN